MHGLLVRRPRDEPSPARANHLRGPWPLLRADQVDNPAQGPEAEPEELRDRLRAQLARILHQVVNPLGEAVFSRLDQVDGHLIAPHLNSSYACVDMRTFSASQTIISQRMT